MMEQKDIDVARSDTSSPASGQAPRRSIRPLVAVLLISLAPVVAAVLVYFNPDWRPEGSSNYGTLVDPQRHIPDARELPLTTLDGQPFDLASLQGQWVLVAADGAACPESCARKLFILRNIHASQGKNVERVTRVWFITDDAAVPDKVIEAYQGTIMLRADPRLLARFLAPAETGPAALAPGLTGPMWVIDPLGNLMMQFPPDADPLKVRKDIGKLIYNSRIG